MTTASGKALFLSLLHLSEKKAHVATAFSDSDVTGKANELVCAMWACLSVSGE